jgi:hypothetical protein
MLERKRKGSEHSWGDLIAASRRGRWITSTLSIVLSVLLHFALIGTIIWGGARAKHVGPAPVRQGVGAIASGSSQEPVMTLILISDPRSTHAQDASDEQMASRGLLRREATIEIASPDAMPAIKLPEPRDVVDDTADNEADSSATRATLYARYIGQIRARIDRAWRRPRTAIGADSFGCAVLIEQDHSGNVLQTTLQRCNGTLRWQLSLVQAIQSASPLPAPPDPNVFANAVSLEFNSGPYIQGLPADGFETAASALAAASASNQILQLNPTR